MEKRDVEQLELRGDGKIPSISIKAESLGEASHKAISACYNHGVRIETPKHKIGDSLGYDADITVRVNSPESEEHIYRHGTNQTGVGMLEYSLEVTHGIHNHRKKCKEHPDWWGYTYNERFVDQIPLILQRIKTECNQKGRITGRDYQFTIWRPGEDVILEQEDPPCWQRGQFRFLKNSDGKTIMNYQTDWRSRDLLKAWTDNNVAQIEFMKLFRDKVSDMLGIPIKLGAYIDRSTSLHIYGYYLDDKNTRKQLEMIAHTSHENTTSELRTFSLKDYILYAGDETLNSLEQVKTFIAAQLDAEAKGNGLQQKRPMLKELGYDLSKVNYPKEWDSWPKSWDAEPDITKLARVVN